MSRMADRLYSSSRFWLAVRVRKDECKCACKSVRSASAKACAGVWCAWQSASARMCASAPARWSAAVSAVPLQKLLQECGAPGCVCILWVYPAGG
eukprot:scaffold57520_cov27-Tisochrysis_lutea.AAC.3